MGSVYYIFLSLLCFGCFITKAPKTHYSGSDCVLCDSLLKKSTHLIVPVRQIDKNLLGTPLPHENGLVLKPDSIMVLSMEEAQNVINSLFCFIGKSEATLDNYLQSSDTLVFHVYGPDRFLKVYSYYLGSYFLNGKMASQQEAQHNEHAEFYLTHSSSFGLTFYKDQGKILFAGTQVDSINLIKCRKKKGSVKY